MALSMSLSVDALSRYTARQLSTSFPDRDIEAAELLPHVRAALERLEHCFAHIEIKYYFDGRSAVFNHQNTDQYASFLYLLSNTLHRAGDASTAAKSYALNKALHGIDVFYEVELPSIFCFQHPLGSVLGRARYADYLFVYQRCSVGSSLKGEQPTFGPGVVMFGGASVIGGCTIGSNVLLSVNACVMDEDVPSDRVVFGRSPALTLKPTRRSVRREMFLRVSG